MHKEFMIGNKIICQKLHKKEKKRQLSKLQEIKNRPNSFQTFEPAFFRQTALASDSEKIIEIERSNIVLFNRIASIIKQRPKMSFPKSRQFVKSLDNALFIQEKKKQQLKIKHQLYEKRISEQQPTIKNDIIFKERMRHQRYLKFIGKYPFNPHRRTQSDVQEERNKQIFHTKSLDFEVKIIKNSLSDCYVFTVLSLTDGQGFELSMATDRFREKLAECGNSYGKMVARLRMDKGGAIRFAETEDSSTPPQTYN